MLNFFGGPRTLGLQSSSFYTLLGALLIHLNTYSFCGIPSRWWYPKALRTHICRAFGPKTTLFGAFSALGVPSQEPVTRSPADRPLYDSWRAFGRASTGRPRRDAASGRRISTWPRQARDCGFVQRFPYGRLPRAWNVVPFWVVYCEEPLNAATPRYFGCSR